MSRVSRGTIAIAAAIAFAPGFGTVSFADDLTLAISMRSLSNPYHATFAKGGEVFAQRLLVRLRQSATVATKFLDRFLVRIGASAALRESASRILSKTLPLGIGVAIGATVNYLKLHLFARRQLHRMQVTAD